MLKSKKYFCAAARPEYSRSSGCFLLSRISTFLEIMRGYFSYIYIYIYIYINMHIYPHVCTCEAVCSYKRTYMHHNFAFSLTYGLSHLSLLLSFSLHIPRFHLPHVSRAGSRHIQHVGLGDDLAEIMSFWEAHGSGFCHDDVIKWKHFPRYWPLVREIHRWPVDFPHKGQWRGTLMFCLICACTNALANSGDPGDLRHHRSHYDVEIMP